MAAALYIILIAAALAGAAFGVIERRRSRRVLESLDSMLDAAIRGNFREEDFDESLLSAVETRFYQYLSGCGMSVQNLQAERDKIHELVADISHQTKTPVANVLLYTELLKERNLDGDSRALVSQLEIQTEKLHSLIDALVKTSRLETGILQFAPKSAPVQPMLEKAVAQYVPKAEEKGVTLTLSDSPARAVFDSKWTGEAVCNLLDNAIKYTPSGGSITVSAVSFEMFCRIDVSDTGIGIPEPERARVFGRFYRSEAAADTEGVGIGLYLTRQIAAGQGGYVKLSSAPGRGSTFSLYLPK